LFACLVGVFLSFVFFVCLFVCLFTDHRRMSHTHQHTPRTTPHHTPHTTSLHTTHQPHTSRTTHHPASPPHYTPHTTSALHTPHYAALYAASHRAARRTPRAALRRGRRPPRHCAARRVSYIILSRISCAPRRASRVSVGAHHDACVIRRGISRTLKPDLTCWDLHGTWVPPLALALT
jgi:hypothetical protein